MTDIAVLEKEEELKENSTKMDEHINALVVDDEGSFEHAGEITLELSALEKKIEEYWDPEVKKAHELHKSLTTKRSEMLTPVQNNKKILKNKINAYLTEQENKRKAEEARLEEERLAAEKAERDRIQAEIERERAQKEAEIEAAKESGNVEEAEKIQAEAEEAIKEMEYQKENVSLPSPVPTVSTPPKRMSFGSSGSASASKDITVTVTNKLELIKAIAEGKAPITLLDVKEGDLKKFIKLLAHKEFPGLEIKDVVNASFRKNK